MRLVDIGNGTYVNIDLVLSTYKGIDGYHLIVNDNNRTSYLISEKAYYNILAYGKANKI